MLGTRLEDAVSKPFRTIALECICLGTLGYFQASQALLRRREVGIFHRVACALL